MIEALPHMLSSMALLWGVLMKEESQKRALDSAQGGRLSSASVFFKGTKVRPRVLVVRDAPSLAHALIYCRILPLNRLAGLAAAHPGVPAPPHRPVRSVAHGLAGRRVEQEEEQEKE